MLIFWKVINGLRGGIEGRLERIFPIRCFEFYKDIHEDFETNLPGEDIVD